MKVGFTEGEIHDASRTDWDGGGARPISWTAWYPANVGAAKTPMRGGGTGEPWFDIGTAVPNADLRSVGEKLPVVLVSHGTGGTAFSMGWIARRLAERGFVALAPNHHGNTALEHYRAEGFLCWWERARDLSILLDHVLVESRFADRLDPDRVYAVGFSLGCHTALSLLGAVTDVERFREWAEQSGGPPSRGPREFPDLADHVAGLKGSHAFEASLRRSADNYRDPRIRAALLLAPAPTVRAFTDASLAAIHAPVQMMTGGADSEAPSSDGADWLAARLRFAEVQHLGSTVGHYVFLPESTDVGRREAPDVCDDALGVDRRAVHDMAAAAALRLFQAASSSDEDASR